MRSDQLPKTCQSKSSAWRVRRSSVEPLEDRLFMSVSGNWQGTLVQSAPASVAATYKYSLHLVQSGGTVTGTGRCVLAGHPNVFNTFTVTGKIANNHLNFTDTITSERGANFITLAASLTDSADGQMLTGSWNGEHQIAPRGMISLFRT